MTRSFARELDVAKNLAREAGRILLEVYATDFDVSHKAHNDGPVTEADRRANTFLVEELRRAFPADGVVAEESKDNTDSQRFSRCWFIDPLDGTKEFVERNGMFAIHIGLAVEGVALLGVVYRPVGDKLYAGVVGEACVLEHSGATTKLCIPPDPPSDLRLVISRSHKSRKLSGFMRELGIKHVLEHGSVGLKCGLIAEGLADLYIHPTGKSHRWDACAPEAVMRAAGGVLTDLAGDAYRYDGVELRNSRGLLACSEALFPRVQPVVARIAHEAGLL